MLSYVLRSVVAACCGQGAGGAVVLVPLLLSAWLFAGALNECQWVHCCCWRVLLEVELDSAVDVQLLVVLHVVVLHVGGCLLPVG